MSLAGDKVNMNIEHKLEVFSKSTILEAKEIRDNMLKGFKRKLNEEYEAREQLEEKSAHERIQKATNELTQILNHDLTKYTSDMRKSLARERITLIEEIFENVMTKISEFRHTEQYNNYICDQIAKIRKQYGSEIKVYLSEEDSFLRERVRVRTGIDTYISEKSFIGGIRAVVKDGKLSVDKTFLSKLSAERESFNYLKLID